MVLSIDAKYRGNGISAALKWRQYKEAKEKGIAMIHWTVDPLQMVNAGLNFNSLGAVAAEHTRGLYSFTNALNKVPASRFGVYWMVDSARSRKASAKTLKIPGFGEITSDMENAQLIIPVYYDDGRPVNYFDYERWEPGGRETILIQIPRNWKEMQDEKIEEAKMWREVTDGIFQKILGKGRGKYIIAGISYDENERIGEKDRGTPYLIARRFDTISHELVPVKN